MHMQMSIQTFFLQVNVKIIASVKPTGWHQNKYDFVDQGSLYNRCHLIAYSLTGENANEKNLVTGTRYMNTDGMGSFEKQILENLSVRRKFTCYTELLLFSRVITCSVTEYIWKLIPLKTTVSQ